MRASYTRAHARKMQEHNNTVFQKKRALFSLLGGGMSGVQELPNRFSLVIGYPFLAVGY